MSKIRMALLKNCEVIGVAWVDKSGVGQAIKINVPRRKQEVIRRAIKEGIDFPKEKKAEPVAPVGETESGVLYKKPSLILPADLRNDQPEKRPLRPGEITL